MSLPVSRPVKLAIVGTGLIGPRHAEAILHIPGAELLCIVDPSPAAEAVAQRFQCPLYSSVDEMLLHSDKPDGVLVCTPNHTHVPISKILLENGVHVICEKPISIDVPSGKELVQCADAYGKHLLIGHHRRFNPYVVATKAAIEKLGRIIAVSGSWTIYKPPEYFDPPTDWRRLDSAGPILINLIHDVDILHYWFGPIVRVFAESTVSQRGFDAEEGAAITLKFANGIVGTFILSDAVVSPHNFEAGTGENPLIPKVGYDCYRIFGAEGSLSFPDLNTWTYREIRSWNKTLQSGSVDVPEMKAPFDSQIEHFTKVIRGEEVPSCSGRDGLRAVAVCEAVRKSMKESRPIEIPVDI